MQRKARNLKNGSLWFHEGEGRGGSGKPQVSLKKRIFPHSGEEVRGKGVPFKNKMKGPNSLIHPRR